MQLKGVSSVVHAAQLLAVVQAVNKQLLAVEGSIKCSTRRAALSSGTGCK